jgi:hypothetical protein
MLIDKAYKVLTEAQKGNKVSEACYNDWAKKNKLPLFPNPEYEKVKDYDTFYNVAYYYIFGD